MVKPTNTLRRRSCFAALSVATVVLGFVATVVYYACSLSTAYDVPEAKRSVLRNYESRAPNASERKERPCPRILFWTNYWESRLLALNETEDIMVPNCTRPCRATYNRALFNVSDVVVFHCRDINAHKMPTERYPHQKWVFWCMEAPPFAYVPTHDAVDSQFNWTMTYRDDSDVIMKYGGFTRRQQPITLELEEDWRTKNKTAVWVVSHCHAHSKRENFVKELRKYVDIDVYGTCGPLKCPRMMKDTCYRLFEKKYYFYLSLENSLCDEYVTEKLYHTLQFNIIPVALGAVNYDVRAPPHSVIDVASFATPRQLAYYLKRAMSVYDLYKSYLEWKWVYDVREWNDYEESFCGLCEKLHSPDFRRHSVYDSVRSWWTKKSACYTYNDPTWIAVQSKIKLVRSPLTPDDGMAN